MQPVGCNDRKQYQTEEVETEGQKSAELLLKVKLLELKTKTGVSGTLKWKKLRFEVAQLEITELGIAFLKKILFYFITGLCIYFFQV